MPTKKQRRRKLKDKRHEWEYVEYDEEGNEIVLDQAEVSAVTQKKKDAPAAKAVTRGARTVSPPSWKRVLKRGLIFAPFMYLTITLIGKDLTTSQRLFQTGYLLVLFIPFSYLMDRMMYKRFARQSGS